MKRATSEATTVTQNGASINRGFDTSTRRSSKKLLLSGGNGTGRCADYRANKPGGRRNKRPVHGLHLQTRPVLWTGTESFNRGELGWKCPAEGEPVIWSKNNLDRGLTNGSMGRIQRIENDEINAILDGAPHALQKSDTVEMVSCDGIECLNFKKSLKTCSFERPKSSHLSAVGRAAKHSDKTHDQ